MGFFDKLFGGGEKPAPAPQEAAKSNTDAAEEQFFGATLEKNAADKAALDKWNAEQAVASDAKASTERDMAAAAEARRAAIEEEASQIVVDDADDEVVNG